MDAQQRPDKSDNNYRCVDDAIAIRMTISEEVLFADSTTLVGRIGRMEYHWINGQLKWRRTT